MNSTAVTRLSTLGLGVLLCIGLLAAGVTQEVPIGGLRGLVLMKENGKPLPKAAVTIEYLGDDSPDGKRFRTYTTDEHGQFNALRLVAGSYTIEIDARAHNAKRTTLFV